MHGIHFLFRSGVENPCVMKKVVCWFEVVSELTSLRLMSQGLMLINRLFVHMMLVSYVVKRVPWHLDMLASVTEQL